MFHITHDVMITDWAELSLSTNKDTANSERPQSWDRHRSSIGKKHLA